MERRQFVAAAGTVTATLFAGCANPDDDGGDDGPYGVAGPSGDS